MAEGQGEGVSIGCMVGVGGGSRGWEGWGVADGRWGGGDRGGRCGRVRSVEGGGVFVAVVRHVQLS
jgi:hypothetical protein